MGVFSFNSCGYSGGCVMNCVRLLFSIFLFDYFNGIRAKVYNS